MNTVTPFELERFQVELVRRGLPIDFAGRAAEELIDHHRDLAEELRASGLAESAAISEASRRLGDTRTLVDKTVREYRRRHWCGRWPLVTFVLSPVPAMCLFWLAMAAILAGVSSFCDVLGIALTQPDSKTSFFERALVEGMWSTAFLLGPALVCSLFARMARRSGLSPAWVLVVAAQLAFFVGLNQFNIDYERCWVQVGWPIDMPALSGWMAWYFGSSRRHLTQVMGPLILAILICAAQVADRRRAVWKIAC